MMESRADQCNANDFDHCRDDLNCHACSNGRERFDRLSRSVQVDDPGGLLTSNRTLIGITSSRLGRDASTHQIVGRFLARAVMDARVRDACLMIAAGSAIFPWAVRAANLFGVDWIRLRVEVEDEKNTIADGSKGDVYLESTDGSSLQRDETLIQIADRVEAVHVRRGGTIAKAISNRLEASEDKKENAESDYLPASIRVALFGHSKCAGADLIQQGAVGWYSPRSQSVPEVKRKPTIRWKLENLIQHDSPSDENRWADVPGQWLVHCTRTLDGPWPDQTQSQYLDEILIGDSVDPNRSSIITLQRILRTGRLLASSIATAKSHPVVCFTERALTDILAARCFRPHLGRWDYEPYGIAIQRSYAESIGVQPVIYGQPSERKKLPACDRYRFHPIGKTYDWRSEKEWRSERAIQLSEIPNGAIRIFAPASDENRKRLARCNFPITWLVPDGEVTDDSKPSR